MRLSRVWLAVLLLAATLGWTGCWDRAELEETAFITALGIDKGESQPLAVTAAIALPSKAGGGEGGGGGGGGKGKPYIITRVEAPTIPSALSLMSTYVDRMVSLQHNKVLFVGEELARESLTPFLDTLVRFRQSRGTLYMVVTREKAFDFMSKMEPEVEKVPEKFIEQMTYTYRRTGLIPAMTQLQTFLAQSGTELADPLAYYAGIGLEEDQRGPAGRTSLDYRAGEVPRKGGPNMELAGAAVFRAGKMVGTLTASETRLVLLMQDRFVRGVFAIPDPDEPKRYVSLDIRRSRAAATVVNLTGPRIQQLLRLEGDILGIQTTIDHTDPERQGRLEAAFSRWVEQETNRVIRKLQGMEADVIGYGRQVVRQFPTVAEWEAYRWPDRWAKADVSVTVELKLRRFGVRLSPPQGRE